MHIYISSDLTCGLAVFNAVRRVPRRVAAKPDAYVNQPAMSGTVIPPDADLAS